jgi:hypothetical protein
MNPNHPTFTSPFGNGQNPQDALSSWSSSNPPAGSIPRSAAGRKRSRDEAAINLGDDDPFAAQATVPQSNPPENEEEWEYGEGMTLIKPNKPYITEAASQTGTWAEEKAEEKVEPVTPSERPILRATKSQRLNSSVPSIPEEVMQNGTLATPIASSPERSNGLVEPTIDDFTRHLGIGWSLFSQDVDVQSAARGWEKYIENHYPITNVKMALQSKGLASYLVAANEGYFLFQDDLKKGQLVSKNLQRVWENLRGPQPVFDGEITMEAGDTPKAPTATTDDSAMTSAPGLQTLGSDSGFEGSSSGSIEAAPAASNMEVEMDMDMS